MSPFQFLEASGAIFYFSIKFIKANRIAPDGTPRRTESSNMGLFCFICSIKRTPRLYGLTSISKEGTLDDDFQVGVNCFASLHVHVDIPSLRIF